ncbi:MAG: paraslipin [Spirulinaceae cyanobacterium SM2_1_0]|nr:paraslipin [Spirulinaceae cyanobacterium SM2_1_0]
MEPLFYATITFALGSIGYAFASLKIINEGNEALVERLGQYHKKLNPGLNFIVPVLDSIVVEETTREKVLGIEPQSAITKDNVSLKIDAVVYWQIIDLEKTFYVVEDIKTAIENLVVTTLRSAIGRLELEETYSSRYRINQTLLQQLDEATANWGVKVTRVEVREISPAKTVMESLEQERAAESRKRATLLETEGTVRSIEMLANALKTQSNSQDVLNFLVTQRYVEANEKLGESNNSKIVFMDPKSMTEAMSDLISGRFDPPPHQPPPQPPDTNGLS